MRRAAVQQRFDVRGPGDHSPSMRYRGLTLLELLIVLVILTAVGAVAWPRLTGRMRVIAPREAAFALGADLADAREQAIRSGEAWAVRIERHRQNYEWGPVSSFQERERIASPAMSSLGAVPVGIRAPEGRETPSARQPADRPTGADSDTAVQRSPTGEPQKSTRLDSILRGTLPPDIVFEHGQANKAFEANPLATNLPAQSVRPLPGGLAPGQPGMPQRPAPPAAPGLGTPTMPQRPWTPTPEWQYAVIFQPDGRATQAEIRLKDVSSHYQIRVRVRGLTGGISFGDVERPAPHPPSIPSHNETLSTENISPPSLREDVAVPTTRAPQEAFGSP